MAIKVTSNGNEKVYDKATSFETDGYGDVVLLDENGNKVALVARSKNPEVEVLD